MTHDGITTDRQDDGSYMATYPHGHKHSLHCQGFGATREQAVRDLRRQAREYETDAKEQNRLYRSQS
jgi:hypothetical protein